MEYLGLYAITVIISGLGSWVIARHAWQFGLLDIPEERSSHSAPIPKGGGIGILLAFITASVVLRLPPGFWLPATVISLVSFYGDRTNLPPIFRLFIQFIAAFIFLLFVSSNLYSSNISPLFLIAFFVLLAVFIVGTANFYNFMDGINGIAGITGGVGFGLFALYSLSSNISSFFVILSLCMVLSCLAFLPFNIPRAKVFMGDIGSILLGFVFAEMVVVLSTNFLDFICLISFLFPFYADELTTMCVRLKRHENLTHPHRKHLYQLLANELEISHWKISVGYGLMQFVVGASVIFLKHLGLITIIIILFGYCAGFITLSIAVRKLI